MCNTNKHNTFFLLERVMLSVADVCLNRKTRGTIPLKGTSYNWHERYPYIFQQGRDRVRPQFAGHITGQQACVVVLLDWHSIAGFPFREQEICLRQPVRSLSTAFCSVAIALRLCVCVCLACICTLQSFIRISRTASPVCAKKPEN